MSSGRIIKLVFGMALMSLVISGTASLQAAADFSKSYGQLRFRAGDEENPGPTDPENPGEPDPVDPEDPDPDPVGEDGLYLVMTPRLDFGAVKISKKDMEYYAMAEYLEIMETNVMVCRPNYIEVMDIRGNRAGWTIMVTADQELMTRDGAVLEGAQIKLKNGVINSGMNNWESQDVYINDYIVLNPNEAQLVMKAEKGSGAGRWYGLFGRSEDLQNINSDGKKVMETIGGEETEVKFNPNITLDVPGKAIKDEKSYSTTLLWTISNTP